MQREVVASNRLRVQIAKKKNEPFGSRNEQRVLCLKTSLGFFPGILDGLIKVIDSLQKYVIISLAFLW